MMSTMEFVTVEDFSLYQYISSVISARYYTSKTSSRGKVHCRLRSLLPLVKLPLVFSVNKVKLFAVVSFTTIFSTEMKLQP